jgi:hypothetical protein
LSGPAGAGVAAGRERAALEEERDFCLRSLRDLDGERAAGDIDEGDYARLRDDYTSRAADVIRRLAALDAAGASTAAASTGAVLVAAGEPAAGEGRRPPLSRRRRVLAAGVAVAAAAAIGAGIAVSVGGRLPGQTVTGNSTGAAAIDQELLGAQKAIVRGDAVGAARDYQRVLDVDAHNPVALTGYGAILVETNQVKLIGRGLVMLADAESADPSYGPAYAYLGRGLAVLGDYQRAIRQLHTFLHDDPHSGLAPQARRLLAFAVRKQRSAGK